MSLLDSLYDLFSRGESAAPAPGFGAVQGPYPAKDIEDRGINGPAFALFPISGCDVVERKQGPSNSTWNDVFFTNQIVGSGKGQMSFQPVPFAQVGPNLEALAITSAPGGTLMPVGSQWFLALALVQLQISQFTPSSSLSVSVVYNAPGLLDTSYDTVGSILPSVPNPMFGILPLKGGISMNLTAQSTLEASRKAVTEYQPFPWTTGIAANSALSISFPNISINNVAGSVTLVNTSTNSAGAINRLLTSSFAIRQS